MVVQRVTRQRQAIGALLADLDDFRSAQQIHALLRERGEDIGLATVYRALGAMAERGDSDVLRTATGEMLYRRCERAAHHHHLVCRVCGRTEELSVPGLEDLLASVVGQSGFAEVDHSLELFGRCATCQRAG